MARKSMTFLVLIISAILGVGIVAGSAFAAAPARMSKLGAIKPIANWAANPLETLTTYNDTLKPLRKFDGRLDPCDPMWSVIPSPSINDSYLDAVAVLSANDAWAVGYYYNFAHQTLVEHWNGTSWSVVSSPNVGASSNILYGAAAVSVNDVWAVGYYCSSNCGTQTEVHQTLVEHWNGTSWSVVSNPNPGAVHSYLNGVAAVSANDVWAVGTYSNGSAYQTLVEHWDGTSWSVVASPNVGTIDSRLYGVAAVSTNDVWAVGGYIDANIDRTLIERWDGTAWSVIPSPNVGAYHNDLLAIAAVSANDVWAVGSRSGNTLIEHWNGTTWSVVSSPNPGAGQHFLYAVAAVSSNDAWAVGSYLNDSIEGQTLIEHWDGTVWSVVSSPSPGAVTNVLHGVAVTSANDVWAVGDYFSDGNQTLVEHYSPSPCTVSLVGHVSWAGQTQPNTLQQRPITLTLCSTSGGPTSTYASTTDASGFFTVNVASLITGTYSWRDEGYNSLANGGVITLTGSDQQMEMGAQRGGDANVDNVDNIQDFSILRTTFQSTTNPRADFNNDGIVNAQDFGILRGNFSQQGAPVTCPMSLTIESSFVGAGLRA